MENKKSSSLSDGWMAIIPRLGGILLMIFGVERSDWVLIIPGAMIYIFSYMKDDETEP